MKKIILFLILILFVGCGKQQPTESTPTKSTPPVAIIEPVPTVTIGNQVWMKYNVNVGTKIPKSTQSTNNNIIEKYCYNNEDSNCTTYGGLYKWDEMMVYSTVNMSQGICPDGFHVPSTKDFGVLQSFLGTDPGRKLKEVGFTHWFTPYTSPPYSQSQANTYNNNITGWDTYGFRGLPSGYADSNFSGIKNYGYFWTSTIDPVNTNWVYYRTLGYSIPTFYEYEAYRNGVDASYMPLRCIKNK